ncbi:3051_t:CDS:2 [Dentiscutata heterogama]|uniref:3051_t:CDS:1 n=1 Tax=Dentiscutata heterogama TaxID=1316150 RepID=A0ACA9NCU1_9GLOM|nr:3051_t:CDS:2 [Dentiscutata heterogama]
MAPFDYLRAIETLHELRKSGERKSALVVSLGERLLRDYTRKLGDEVWPVYEQVFISALDHGNDALAKTCFEKLEKRFPGSPRVKILEGMKLEAEDKLDEALRLYDEIYICEIVQNDPEICVEVVVGVAGFFKPLYISSMNFRNVKTRTILAMEKRFLATRIAKVLPRIPAVIRKYSVLASSESLSPFAKERLAIEEHAKGTARTWKNITIYVCTPALFLGVANSYRIMKEHEAHHAEHEHEEEHPHFQYQRIRTKPFPWGDGDKTLFHNPKVNK